MEAKKGSKNQKSPSFVIELDGRFYRDGLLKTEEDMKMSRSLV